MMYTKILSLVAFTAAMVSCEPTEIDDKDFHPNDNDTTTTLGFKMSMKTNGTTTTYNSQGVGVSCTDSAFDAFWGLATGDSVYYDPTTGHIQTSNPNDTMLVVIWESQNSGTGTYVPSGLNSMFPGFCVMQTPTSFVEYDASQLQINITKLTTDQVQGQAEAAAQQVEQPQSENTAISVDEGAVAPSAHAVETADVDPELTHISVGEHPVSANAATTDQGAGGERA